VSFTGASFARCALARADRPPDSHEPPVSTQPVCILHHDSARDFLVVEKPATMVCYLRGCSLLQH
jgi:hypothetical protein